MQQKPENLFCTKHVLSVVAVFYISTAAPFAEKMIENGVSTKEILQFLNVTLVAAFAGFTKTYDPNVYTPKGMLGRNKEEVIQKLAIEKAEDAPRTEIVTYSPVVVNKPAIVHEYSVDSDLYIKALRDTWLKTKPVQSTDPVNSEKVELKKDSITFITGYHAEIDGHIEIKVGSKTYFVFAEHVWFSDSPVATTSASVPASLSTAFTPTKIQLEQIYNNTLSDALYDDFKACLSRFNISTYEDVCHFLAQIGHESTGLVYTKELADGSDYEGRKDLGNVVDGDGRFYRGAGFIQLTGKFGYQRLADYLHDPEVVNQGCEYVASMYPWTSAGYWWFDNKMSDYINNNHASVEQVSTAVNGANPANGLADRINYYRIITQILTNV